MENIIKTIGSAILTGITFLFGDLNIAMQVLVFCIVLDYNEEACLYDTITCTHLFSNSGTLIGGPIL